MKASINEFLAKIKAFCIEMKEEILVCLIIIFVGLASFGLGKLSVSEVNEKEVRIISGAAAVGAVVAPGVSAQTEAQNSGQVVASKNGTKYHYPWCGGAKQIAEKNKITFATIEEAKAAGYSPAGNCKGLK